MENFDLSEVDSLPDIFKPFKIVYRYLDVGSVYSKEMNVGFEEGN